MEDGYRVEQPEPRTFEDLTVAYLGPAGTHSHLLAISLFGPVDEMGFRYEPRDRLLDVLNAVQSGSVGWGVIPYFNTTSGPVRAVYPALLDVGHGAFEGLDVAACVSWPVLHDLLGTGSLNSVSHVFSKQEAIDQCSRFLNAHSLTGRAIPVDSTAEAVRRAAKEGFSAAAIASSRLCGFRPDLRTLALSIQDDPDNVTRFLVVRSRDAAHDQSIPMPINHLRHTWIVLDSSAQTGVLPRIVAAAREWGIAASTLTGIVTHPQQFGMRFLLELDWPPNSLKMQFLFGDTEYLPWTVVASPIVIGLDRIHELKNWIGQCVSGISELTVQASDGLLHFLSADTQSRLAQLSDWRLYSHGDVETMADVWGVLGLPGDRMVNTQVFCCDTTRRLAVCCVAGGRRVDLGKVSQALGDSYRRLRLGDFPLFGLTPGTVSPMTVPPESTILMDSGFPYSSWIFMGSGDPRVSIAFFNAGARWPFPARVCDIAER